MLEGTDFVILGWFTSDPIEKCFGKLRQGSGGTYFINAKSVIEKVHIQHAKLVLQLGLEIEGDDGHVCHTCKRELNEEESEVFDNLVELEQHINKETFLALVYIAGYVQRCDMCLHAYHELYGEYLDTLNRGGLQIPTDTLVQWSTFCFIYFRQLSGSICRTFCIKKFMLIAETFHFSVT